VIVVTNRSTRSVDAKDRKKPVHEDKSRKIYVAGAIRGGQDFRDNYQALIETIEARRDCVALAEMSLVGRAVKLKEDEAIYRRDRAWLDEADAMVAEISSPSLGVGYEIAYALHVRRIPLLALRHASVRRSSAMVEGNGSPLLQIRSYDSSEDLVQIVDAFICSLT